MRAVRRAAGGVLVVAVALTGLPAAATPQTDSFGPSPAPLADLRVGPASSSPRQGIALGERILFSATGPGGRELYISDGTTGGSSLVADLEPGPNGSDPLAFVAFRGAVYFVASTAAAGAELWRTDGTALGTRQVADIVPGPVGATVTGLTPTADRLYFSATTAAHGAELWESRGDAASTRLAVDVRPGPDGSYPRDLAVVGERLVFGAVDGPGRPRYPVSTDGTPQGTTTMVGTGPGPSDPTSFVTIGSRAAFIATGPTIGSEVFMTDGSTVWPLVDLWPGARGSDPDELTAFGRRIAFVATDQAHGREVRVTDGTAAGTTVREVRPDNASSNPRRLTSLGGRLHFQALDLFHGIEPWALGPTGEPTLLRDFNPGQTHSFVLPLGAVGSVVLLQNWLGNGGSELWRTDGTRAGTTRVALPGQPSATIADGLVGVVGGTALLSLGVPALGDELWSWTIPTARATIRADVGRARRKIRKRHVTLRVAAVTASGALPGQVEIRRAGRVIATQPPSGGQVRLWLRPGRHRFTARYLGSLVAQRSALATVEVRVKKFPRKKRSRAGRPSRHRDVRPGGRHA